MVKVDLSLDPEGKIIGFSITGHANFAPHGEDIVCAAVSAVAQTAVIGLQKYLDGLPEVKQQKGKLVCKLPANLPGEKRRIADAILNTMYWGLEAIQSEYKQYVKVITRRCK